MTAKVDVMVAHIKCYNSHYENIAPRRMCAAGQLQPAASAELRHTFTSGSGLYFQTKDKVKAFKLEARAGLTLSLRPYPTPTNPKA